MSEGLFPSGGGDPRTACAGAIDVALLMALLLSTRFDLATEASIQRGIEKLLIDHLGEAGFAREARLDPLDRPDFMVPVPGLGGVAIEVKHRRAKATPTLRQLTRYAGHGEVAAIILATGWPMPMPAALNGKPVHVVSLGRAWL